ncbi:hypothetical protein [Vibrio diabolicus]|uniref:hypothetical protein n=1 Tax=Vibrio diabolicus TaxID=50719 RepID=UPI00193B2FB8|nr:hypothetical protein [Vibrio diabolicus]EHK9073604.1 hypothetical protein [Vibrio parahaemolyticus]EIY6182620.1 hypothetical protein [Vibrio parahaemolyticus]EIZ1178930.1 hypothetical protein [Vibrio parahaemolyticus]EJG1101366.1 hypothetical protein [Vibrio parahaemolyticus]EKM6953877.1 hypothetical protein [Vibrio parahaemolyticus]
MAKYTVSYAYYTIGSNGKPSGKTGTQRTVEATSDSAAMMIIASKHPGKEIEWRKITRK